MKRRIIKVLFVALPILAALSVVQGFLNGRQLVDFHWESAALFLRGENPYNYFFSGSKFCGIGVDATQAPSTIVFLLPFGLLDWPVANLVWEICNFAWTATFLFFSWRLWFVGRSRLFFIFACLFLMSLPWREGMGCGQHTMFSLAFFMAALWALNREKPWWLVGLLLAPAMFKYTVTVPLGFYFVMRKAWKPLALCAAIHAGLTVLLGLWTATSPLTLVLQSIKIGRILNSAGGMADLAGLATWLGIESVGIYAIVGYVIFATLLLVVTVRAWKCDFVREELPLLSLLAVIADMICYHRDYDMVCLAFVLAWVMLEWKKLSSWVRAAAIGCVACVFFYCRICFQFGIPGYQPICFFLHMLLLIVLCRRLTLRGNLV